MKRITCVMMSLVICVMVCGCAQEAKEPKVSAEWPMVISDYSCEDILANINYVADAENVEKIVCYYNDMVPVHLGYEDRGQKHAEITDSAKIEEIQECLSQADYEIVEVEPVDGNRYYYTAFYIDGKYVYIGGIELDHIYCGNDSTWLKETESTDLDSIIYHLFEQ